MKPFAALLSTIALAGVLVACPTPATTPDFSLAINPAALTLAAGASGGATLTVTPKNGFSAQVAPSSSDAIVGTGPDKIALDVTASGDYTGALAIQVGANVPAKLYNLTIVGTGGGVSRSVAWALTVTSNSVGAPAPANPSSFTATASSSSAITLSWVLAANATGYSLERKSGAGAYAVIASPTSNGYVDAGLTPATAYTYRLKASNASGSSAGVEASATTLAAPAGGDFTLSVAPATLALAAGGSGNVTVTINRTGGFAGAVALTLEGSSVGASEISGSFAPSPANGGSSTLSLNVGASFAPGSYALTVRGVAGSLNKTAALTVIVTEPKTILLVDDDRSANNSAPSNPSATPSASDTIFKAALDALAPTVGGYNVYVVPTGADGPSFDAIKDYATVIWYTASNYGGPANVSTVSSADEINLKAFLDQGKRKAIIVSNSYIYGLGSNWAAITNSFLNDYIGGVGAKADVLNRVAFTASGVTGAVTAGLSLSVAKDTPIDTFTSVVNPAAGTDTLITVQANPDGTTTRAVAAVTGRTGIGTAGTSKVVYVGFALENIVDISANSKRALLEKLLAY